MAVKNDFLSGVKKHIKVGLAKLLRLCVHGATRLEGFLETLVAKAPALPNDVQVALTKIIPYAVIVTLAVECLVALSVFGGFVFYLFTIQGEMFLFGLRLIAVII
jgi:hypothetical protein